jgi:hypothetical protein
MKDFISKNSSNFESEMLNTLKLSELFNKSMMNLVNKIQPQPATPSLDLYNSNSSIYLKSTLENFKNLSRSYGMNLLSSNVI